MIETLACPTLRSATESVPLICSGSATRLTSYYPKGGKSSYNAHKLLSAVRSQIHPTNTSKTSTDNGLFSTRLSNTPAKHVDVEREVDSSGSSAAGPLPRSPAPSCPPSSRSTSPCSPRTSTTRSHRRRWKLAHQPPDLVVEDDVELLKKGLLHN